MGESFLYENEFFGVEIVKLTDPMLNEVTPMYGVINKATNVREAECRREFTARTLADAFEDQHKHPERYLEVQAPDTGSFGGFGGEVH